MNSDEMILTMRDHERNLYDITISAHINAKANMYAQTENIMDMSNLGERLLDVRRDRVPQLPETTSLQAVS